MEDYIGKFCPVCKKELTETDKVKVCPDCAMPHHEECWEKNGGCSTFGCAQQGTVEKIKPAEKCAKCGAELAEGQEFCHKCGHKVGLSVDNYAESAINDHNGSASKNKGKKKIVIPIVLAIIAVIAVGVGAFIAKTIKEKAIEDYKANASTFYTKVLSDAAKLENIGNDEVSYWRAYIYDDKYSSIETAVLMAQIDNMDAMDTVENNYDEIVSLYKELLDLPKGASNELVEIKDAVKDVYDAYVDFYDTVMDVTGNYNSFSNAFYDTDNAMSKTIKKLGGLVD